MSQFRRSQTHGATMYFSVALADDQSDLLTREIARLREAVRGTLRARPVDVLAWTVLPNRMHTVWRLPERDPNHAERWRLIRAQMSSDRRARPPRAANASLWAPEVEQYHVQEAADLRHFLRLCWQSPVKAGLVDQAEDWPYSSLQADQSRHHQGVAAAL